MKYVESITVSPSSKIIKLDTWYHKAEATVCPCDADKPTVCWYSDDECVATVNPTTGHIYGVSLGTARIYACACDGSGVQDYITVTVSRTVPVERITLNRSYISIEKDTSATLVASIFPEDATDKSLTWCSSNENVASVANGVVCGIRNGTATITATSSNGKSASCTVTVTGDILVTSIELTPFNKTLNVGYSFFPSVTVCPTNATKKSVAWSSANSNIASVNPNSGLVYAKAVGNTTIYATACDGSGVCGCCTVRVVPIYVQDITVCPETLTLDIGEKSCLEATVYPVNATNSNVSWTSGDSNIAEVDTNGCVTAKSVGTTYICANAIDGSGMQGCCEVTCSILSGTDSIGVFRSLSMSSDAPTNVKVEAPAPFGVQFSELKNGTRDIRFVSQIKTLNYSCVGFEIERKYGDDEPSSFVLHSYVAYKSILADGETVCADDGFDYLVVGVMNDIPENTVASFKITPFAITLEEEYLYGKTTLLNCIDTQIIDYYYTVPGLKTIKQCRIRTDMSMDDSAILKDSSGASVKLNVGDTVPLLSTTNDSDWYRILYNGMMLYVTNDGSFEEIDVAPPSIPEGRDIFANPGLDSNINIRSTPFEISGNIIGQFAHGTNLTLTCNTPQNSEWFAVYGKNKNGTYSYGWCSGRYLAYYFLNTIRDCYVRTSMVISPSTILKDSSGKSVVLREDTVDTVRLWKLNTLIGGDYSDHNGKVRNDWFMVEYNGQIAYVTAYSFYVFGFGEPMIDENQEENNPSDDNDNGYNGDYQDFLQTLAYRESSNNYSKVSASGTFLGRYQMGPEALKDIGFIDDKENWTSLANAHGVTDENTFLSNHDAQDYAIKEYHKKLWTYIKHFDLVDKIGDIYQEVTITDSGLIAATHLIGIGKIIPAINNNTDVTDGNGTHASDYMRNMANYDMTAIK